MILLQVVLIDRSIKIWSSTNSKLIKKLIGYTNWVCNLKMLENGDLVSSSNDKTIKM